MLGDAPFVDVQGRHDEFDRHGANDGRVAPDAGVGAVEFFHRETDDSHVPRRIQPQPLNPGMDHRDVGADDEVRLVPGEPGVEEPFVRRVADQRGNPPFGFQRVRFAQKGSQEFLLHPFVEPVRQDKAQARVAPAQAGLDGQLAGVKVVFRHVGEPRRLQAHAYGDTAEMLPSQVDLSQPRRQTTQNNPGDSPGRKNLGETRRRHAGFVQPEMVEFVTQLRRAPRGAGHEVGDGVFGSPPAVAGGPGGDPGDGGQVRGRMPVPARFHERRDERVGPIGKRFHRLQHFLPGRLWDARVAAQHQRNGRTVDLCQVRHILHGGGSFGGRHGSTMRLVAFSTMPILWPLH